MPSKLKNPSSRSGADRVKKASAPKGRSKKTRSEDHRNYTNFEQNLLGRNIEKTYDYFLANRDLFTYRTFRQVEGESSSTIINKLRGTPDLSVFQRMKTSVLSLMQPKVRLYKVSNVESIEEPAGSGRFKVVPLPIPCYREFKFSDNFGYEQAASPDEYLAYESTRPSYRNVGLHSFSMESKGEIHGPYEKNIFAEIKISLKSLKDLEAQPPGEPPPSRGGLRYADLIIFPGLQIDSKTETFNGKFFQIKALIGWTSPSREQLEGLNLSPREIEDMASLEKYNFLLSLGLLDYDISIKDDGQVIITCRYKSFIEQTISNKNTNIFQDSLEVSTEGELTRKCTSDVTLTKVSRLISELVTLVKGINSKQCINDDNCAAKNRMIDLINNEDFFASCYSEANGPGLHAESEIRDTTADATIEQTSSAGKRVKNRASVITWIKDKDNAKAVKAIMKQRIGAFKKIIYESFVDELIDGFPTEKGGTGTRLFCFTAKRPEIEATLGIVPEPVKKGIVDQTGSDSDPTIEPSNQTASLAERDMINSISAAIGKDEKSKSVIVGRCKDLQKMAVQIKEEVAKELADSIEEEAESKDSKKKKKKKDKNKKSTISADTESHTFYYVYLGDIIELACKNAGFRFLPYTGDDSTKAPIFDRACYVKTENKNNDVDYGLSNLRILTGPMEYLDSRGQVRRINIAQFPVSFNYFRAWFLNKIVKRCATQMSVNEFLRMLIKEMVLPAMGTFMDDPILLKNVRPYLVNLTLPGKQTSGEKLNVCGRPIQPFEELLPQSPSIDTDGPSFNFNYTRKILANNESETLIRTSYDYLLVQMSTVEDITSRRGDTVEDTRDGILHFSVGSDVGMVKNMTFKKVEMPYRKEQLHQNATSQGLDQIQQLKFPYNTHLKLLGMPFYTPGMRYYINPSLLGLGSLERRNSLAFQMNLGGYHIITNVRMSIRNAVFETSLSGYQEGHGERGIK